MATGTTIFSRVTVVAPRTRIDVALPSDVVVADLVPLVVDMAGERAADGGSGHGGWTLARLGDLALDASRTLASLGVVDGELLQLRKRSENPPPPQFDDVVDAVAETDPDDFRPWTPETARRTGHIAGGLALFAAAVALFAGGPLFDGTHLAPAIIGGVAAVACLSLGAVLARGYEAVSTGVLVAAAGGLPMAFVAGFSAVPGVTIRANLLLASVLVLVLAVAAIMLIGAGIATFVAVAAAAAIGAVAFLISVVIAHPADGIAAGAATVAVGLISILPRATIWLSKLPLPNVPTSAEELKQDEGFDDYEAVEQRTALAHEYMTGLLIGCGAAVAIGAVLATTGSSVFGIALAIVATLALLLRSRTYANGKQAIAMLTTGILAAVGLGFGWLLTADPTGRLLWVFSAFVLVAAASLVVGVDFPRRRFSPPLRRSVEITEAICLAVILPLALGVMGLYEQLRTVGSGILG